MKLEFLVHLILTPEPSTIGECMNNVPCLVIDKVSVSDVSGIVVVLHGIIKKVLFRAEYYFIQHHF